MTSHHQSRWTWSAWVLGLVVALAAAAPGPGARAANPTVESVRFEGNRLVESDRLMQEIRTRTGAPLDPDVIRADVKALYRLGYFRDIQVRSDPGAVGNVVTFVLTENPRVHEVRVTGNDEINEDKIREVIEVKPRELLDDDKVRADVKKIRELYDAKGYTHAQVESEILPSEQTVDVVYKIRENEEVYVVEFSFEGNEHFDKDTILDVIETKEKWFLSWLTERGLYRKEQVDGDVARISSLYYNNGYLDHRVSEPRLDFREDGLHVTIGIDEGPQYRISSIALSGDVLPDPDGYPLVDRVQSRKDDILNRDLLRQDIQRLTEVYADRGFAFAKVDPATKLDRDAHTVEVVFQIQQGKKVHFRRIEVEGNTKTRDKVVRRELRVSEGSTYSGARLRVSKQRLERLGFFDTIEFEENRTQKDDEVDLKIKVKEGQTGTLSAGAGFSSVDSFLVNLRVTQHNFRGLGESLVANADLGSRRQLIDLQFTEPYLLDTRISAGVSVFNDQQDFNDFTRSRLGGNATIGYPLIEFIDGSLTYGFEHVEISDVAATASATLRAEEGTDEISSITGAVRRNTLNNRFDPTRGSDNLLSAELAGVFLGGTSDFYKLEARTAWYVPVVWGTVFALRGRISYGASLDDGQDLPLFERYFVGGINSVRGYDVRTLGPKDPITGDEIGGNKQLIFNSEFIFPLVPSFGLKGLVFFDAGEAYPEGVGYELDKLRTSAGFGFRWLSPLGPLRLEIGYPLVRREGDDASSLQFSVGAPL